MNDLPARYVGVLTATEARLPRSGECLQGAVLTLAVATATLTGREPTSLPATRRD